MVLGRDFGVIFEIFVGNILEVIWNIIYFIEGFVWWRENRNKDIKEKGMEYVIVEKIYKIFSFVKIFRRWGI